MAYTAQNINIQSHEYFFDFVNSDILLNEFLWRADKSQNILKQSLDNALRRHGYIRMYVITRVTNSGVYINVFNNNVKVWHISFHLEPSVSNPTPPPGALHIRSNIITTTNAYQILRVTAIPMACASGTPTRLQFSAGTFHPTSYTSICGALEPSIRIILNIVEQYFTPQTNRLSLYNDLSNKMRIPHPNLMAIIRTRPTHISRSTLTAGLIGGKRYGTTRKLRTRRYKHTGMPIIHTRNNRTYKKNMSTHKSSRNKRGE
jgi:hypothetical protein